MKLNYIKLCHFLSLTEVYKWVLAWVTVQERKGGGGGGGEDSLIDLFKELPTARITHLSTRMLHVCCVMSQSELTMSKLVSLFVIQ